MELRLRRAKAAAADSRKLRDHELCPLRDRAARRQGEREVQGGRDRLAQVTDPQGDGRDTPLLRMADHDVHHRLRYGQFVHPGIVTVATTDPSGPVVA